MRFFLCTIAMASLPAANQLLHHSQITSLTNSMVHHHTAMTNGLSGLSNNNNNINNNNNNHHNDNMSNNNNNKSMISSNNSSSESIPPSSPNHVSNSITPGTWEFYRYSLYTEINSYFKFSAEPRTVRECAWQSQFRLFGQPQSVQR